MYLILISNCNIQMVSSTEKDWEDIKFGVENGVDFYAVSFVKNAAVVHELKDYLKGKLFQSLINLFSSSSSFFLKGINLFISFLHLLALKLICASVL